MAKKKAKKSASSPAVTLRFANPRSGARMAKKKTRKSPRRRRNPSNPKKGSHRRRRRNPGTYAERAGKLAAGAAVAVGTAVLVTYGTAKVMPGSNVSLYGIPAATFLVGAAVARTMPTLGVGMALGSFAPFALPLTSKLLTATAPSAPAATAAGIARSMRNMRAVSMGRMGAIDMGAVDMSYAR